jgi:chromate reductase
MRILCLAGSLRRDSWNRRLLQAAIAKTPGPEMLLYQELASVPLFNEDAEENCAPGVQRFREAVGAADGLLIATPEYNQSFPGVLKNAIDWLSRGSPSMLAGKPLAVMGATTGSWGTRLAQTALRQVLTATGALVMPRPMLFIARVHACFDADDRLVDPEVHASLDALLSALQDWIALFRVSDRGKHLHQPSPRA